MSLARRVLLLIFGVAFLLPVVPALADRPPSWMIGRFEGRSRRIDADLTLTISRDGDVRQTGRYDSGKTYSASGEYRDGRLYIDRYAFNVSRNRNGFRVTQTDDRRNTVEFRRIGDDGDDDRPDRPSPPSVENRVPTWAIGTFSGTNRRENVDVELDIRPNGNARYTITDRDGRSNTYTGYMTNGRLRVLSKEFYIERTGNGLRMTEVGNRDNTGTLRRTGGRGDRPGDDDDYDRVPSWLEGRFTGRDRDDDLQLEMTISRSGRVTQRGRYADGRTYNTSGGYDNGRIRLGGMTFEVERQGNGFRMTQVGNRNNSVNFRRR